MKLELALAIPASTERKIEANDSAAEELIMAIDMIRGLKVEFFVHLKPELLTRFPASNEKKIVLFMGHFQIDTFQIEKNKKTEHLAQNILSISVAFYFE